MKKFVLLIVGCSICYVAGGIHDSIGLPSWFDPICGLGWVVVYYGASMPEEGCSRG